MRVPTFGSRVVCVVAICVSLWSCASQKPPFKVAIVTAAGYAGAIHVKLCQADAQVTARLDAQGFGASSACPGPGDNVEIRGTRGDDSVFIPHDSIHVVKTGDEIPVALDADLK